MIRVGSMYHDVLGLRVVVMGATGLKILRGSVLRCRDHGLMWVTGLYRKECWSDALQVRHPSWQVS